MDIDALRYFAAAAKEEHFGRAADALAISQPALSRSIARLEEHYGVALFERDGRGIRITRSGRALLRRVERVIAELEDARRELHDLSEERRSRPIALGFFATLGSRTGARRDPRIPRPSSRCRVPAASRAGAALAAATDERRNRLVFVVAALRRGGGRVASALG